MKDNEWRKPFVICYANEAERSSRFPYCANGAERSSRKNTQSIIRRNGGDFHGKTEY